MEETNEKTKKIDVLGIKKISKQDLSEEIRCEIDVLGGLDIFTDAHVQGVVKTTTGICEEMNLKYEDLKKCVLCAYLHDVGKSKFLLQSYKRLENLQMKNLKK